MFLPSQRADVKAEPKLRLDCSTRWEPGKGSGEVRTARRRIEITVETEWMLTIRRRGGNRLWCQQCGREVEVVRAEILAGTGQLQLGTGAEAKAWHLFESPDGTPLVCLESLLNSR